MLLSVRRIIRSALSASPIPAMGIPSASALDLV